MLKPVVNRRGTFHIPEELLVMNITLEEYDKVMKIASENIETPWVVKQNLYSMRERCLNSIGLCKLTIDSFRRKTNKITEASQMEALVLDHEKNLVPIVTPYNNSTLVYSLLLVRENAAFKLISKTSNSLADLLANSSPS